MTSPQTLPLVLFLSHILLITFLATLTPATSRLRPLLFPLILIIAYLQSSTALSLPRSTFAGSLASTPFTLTIHALNILFLNPIDARNPGVNHSIGYNLRGIGTRWLAKNTPDFPAFYRKHGNIINSKNGDRGEPQPQPHRLPFLLRQSAILIWQYLLIDLCSAASAMQSAEETERLQGAGMEFVIVHATREQWIARLSTAVVSWFVMSRLLIDSVARLMSVVIVGTGMSRAEEWPPMFGGMGDAYTLRGFWGKFWHQLLRWSYTSVSNHFTRRILRLRHPSLIERYANILTIFILSGLGHVLVFAGSGIPMAEWSGSMLFFCSFAAGFMTEDGVQELWRRTGIEKRLFADGRNARGLSLFKRIVGWVWVLGFLSVVSPFFCYPMSRVPTGKEGMVPYSVVERVGVEGALGTVVAGGVGLWFGLEARGV